MCAIIGELASPECSPYGSCAHRGLLGVASCHACIHCVHGQQWISPLPTPVRVSVGVSGCYGHLTHPFAPDPHQLIMHCKLMKHCIGTECSLSLYPKLWVYRAPLPVMTLPVLWSDIQKQLESCMHSTLLTSLTCTDLKS